MLRPSLLLVAATLAFAACGGSNGDNESAPADDAATPQEYVALLKRHYTPVHDRFIETIDPCIGRDFDACDKTGTRVREAAATFGDEMEGVVAPTEVQPQDQRLRKGVAALDDAIAQQHDAIAAKDEEAFDQSIDAVEEAIAQMDGAAHDINARYASAELPTVH